MNYLGSGIFIYIDILDLGTVLILGTILALLVLVVTELLKLYLLNFTQYIPKVQYLIQSLNHYFWLQEQQKVKLLGLNLNFNQIFTGLIPQFNLRFHFSQLYY